MKLFNKEKGVQNNKTFFNNILSVVFVFLIMLTFYSVFVENKKEIEEITIFQLTQDIIAGEVTKITVERDKFSIEYAAEKETGETEPIVKESKKEVGVSLSDTLVNYGVTPEQLSKLDIDIKNSSGLKYWLMNFMPFLVPILLPVFFFLIISVVARFLYRKIRHIYRRT